MKTREINKDPDVPVLTHRAISHLSELCFRKDDELVSADVLFIFGTSFGIADIAKAAGDILEKGIVTNVVVAGGSPVYPDVPKMSKSEAVEILHALNIERFPMCTFRSENDSLNSLDNVRLSLRFPEFAKARKIIFMFRSHACGRGFLTLKKFLPHAILLQKAVSASYETGAPAITKDSWHKHAASRRRVWGEYLRIETYGARGDIHYPQNIQDLVNVIRNETTRS